jgi:hypothetical protein
MLLGFLRHPEIHSMTSAKCYLFVLYNKKEIFTKTSFVVRRKDFRTLFDVITIYTKQSMQLTVDNCEMAVIGLSLK